MKTTLVTMDGNWLMHRAYHAAARSASPESQPRVVARQLVAWAFSYSLQHQATHMLVAMDGHKCFRKQLYPMYKLYRAKVFDSAGRRLEPPEVKVLMNSGQEVEYVRDIMDDCEDAVIEMLQKYHVPFIQLAQFEADDILVASAKYAIDDSVKRVVLVSKDKDIIQALTTNVIQWYPGEGKGAEAITITHADMGTRLSRYVHKDAARWMPVQFRDYQVLIGDPTDDVPEILSPAKARAIINEHQTLYRYFQTKAGERFFYSNEEALLLNRQLVTMRKDSLDEVSLDALRYRTPKTLPSNPTKQYLDYTGWIKVAANPKSLF